MAAALIAPAATAAESAQPLQPLEVRDGHFVRPDGTAERFWGVNLVSVYPTEAEAEALAARLASLGVNLVRPHHLMRHSKDWVWRAPCAALARYEGDSRAPDDEAWRRFDILNAALRRRGIRLALSLHQSRSFRPGDAAILDGDDAKEWANAIAELNGWPWQKSIDPVKMLPAIDERALLLQQEFTRTLLLRRNPATGLTYAEDPQVVTIEVVNESSSNYALVCGNSFPEYFERKLQTRWEEFARERGIDAPGDHRQAGTPALRCLRARFYQSLDEAHFRAIARTVRECGSKAALTYSNLWRGDDALAMHVRLGDTIEDHAYVDPLVTRGAGDWMDATLSRTRVAGKPFILGEFNEAEGDGNIRAQAFARTQLMLAGAAYGCYHDIDGVVWFAYAHGDRNLAPDGRGKAESRAATLGDMACDTMMLDHIATCSRIFRAGLVRPAGRVLELPAAVPADATNYGALMAGTAPALPPGALSLCSTRKVFASADGAALANLPEHRDGSPAIAANAPSTLPQAPQDGIFESDTHELVRDVRRRQLLVRSPFAEAFSGDCSAAPASAFGHLDAGAFTGDSAGAAFATIVLADNTDSARPTPIADASRLLLSRTALLPDGADAAQQPVVRIRNLRAGDWRFRVLRPEAAARALSDIAGADVFPLRREADGSLTLPRGTWTQLELVRADD